MIYLSPLPWTSFEQRPHKFARWFHLRTGGKVLWIDPYPTRLPKLSDFKRLRFSSNGNLKNDMPAWLEVIRPASLPIEPLGGSEKINKMIWRKTLIKAFSFAHDFNAIVAIGKPSALANQVLDGLPEALSIYDAMDDFPAFYAGISKKAMLSMLNWETQIVDRVSTLVVSSTILLNRWSAIRADTKLIYNGLDVSALPNAELGFVKSGSPIRFGYVGTISAWFDWSWLIKLAEIRPNDEIVVIGPQLVTCPYELPDNIYFKPACEHQEALMHMKSFDVGLIPFLRNQLTSSVDPIKYYEYRALGVSVLSTAFGEMLFRFNEPGTFVSKSNDDLDELASQAVCWSFTKSEADEFAIKNSWNSRFDQIKLY
ncbi:glycosyl transferase [Vreelandella nanhaiensis]|uniref:Glycosyl transferase n=1 Tax=Vreelandella nanhaiensis TaxID=1258546 RepID=A0A3S0YY03_9GAMM|nr:glycosyl transferase [Halomonas nanhaiensis]